MDQPSSRFRYLLAESVMIIVSILVAFALDAWWDNQQDREAEQAYLAALHSDFLETRARLAVTKDHELEVIRDSRRLLGMEEDPPPTGTALDSMLFAVWSLPALEPVNGALDELVSSGQLRLIRDEPLRTALAAWAADVEQYQRREGWAQDNWNFLIAPSVTRDMSIAQLAAGFLGESPTEPHPVDHSALLSEQYTRNLLVHRWITARDVLDALDRLGERCDLILARIEPNGPGQVRD